MTRNKNKNRADMRWASYCYCVRTKQSSDVCESCSCLQVRRFVINSWVTLAMAKWFLSVLLNQTHSGFIILQFHNFHRWLISTECTSAAPDSFVSICIFSFVFFIQASLESNYEALLNHGLTSVEMESD